MDLLSQIFRLKYGCDVVSALANANAIICCLQFCQHIKEKTAFNKYECDLDISEKIHINAGIALCVTDMKLKIKNSIFDSKKQ